MSALDMVRRASEVPTRDLWPRVRGRIAADDRVEIRLPAITWPAATAMAAVIGMLVVVPEPARFLAACGML
jgi:hypothetical protein